MRDGARALIAVVQRSKDDAWVLPRGKLKRDENPVTGARREVDRGNRPPRARARISRRHHLPRGRTAESRAVLADAGGGRSKLRIDGRYRRGRMAAAESGGAAPELSAGEIVSAQYRPPGAAKPRARRQRKAAPQETQNGSKAKPKSKTAKAKAQESEPDTRAKQEIESGKRPRRKRAPKADGKTRRPKRLAPAAATNAQTERTIAAIAAVAAKPITAAKRKSILQRMLGRLAG